MSPTATATIAAPGPPSSVRPVEELVVLARGGEPEAMTHLFRIHRPAAAATARRHLREGADIDDAVAEAFTRTFERLSSLRDPTRFRAFLCTCVRNVAYDRQRGRAMVDLGDGSDERPCPGRPVEELIEDADQHARLCRAVTELPARQRYALWRFYWEDATVGAIALDLELTENATTQLLFRARAALAGRPGLGRGRVSRRARLTR